MEFKCWRVWELRLKIKLIAFIICCKRTYNNWYQGKMTILNLSSSFQFVSRDFLSIYFKFIRCKFFKFFCTIESYLQFIMMLLHAQFYEWWKFIQIVFEYFSVMRAYACICERKDNALGRSRHKTDRNWVLAQKNMYAENRFILLFDAW